MPRYSCTLFNRNEKNRATKRLKVLKGTTLRKSKKKLIRIVKIRQALLLILMTILLMMMLIMMLIMILTIMLLLMMMTMMMMTIMMMTMMTMMMF